ncbi:hypothetical protein ACFDTO_25445 [Microbacteriaceae bacterium 4G12]
MDKPMKLFLGVVVGWLLTIVAGTMGSSLTAFFHFFSITAIDGFINFLQYVVTFVGWFSVMFLGYFALYEAWKSRK